MMRNDHLNLTLEIFSLALFLISAVFLAILTVLWFNIVGIELTDDVPKPNELEVIVRSAAGYLNMNFTLILLASFPLIVVILVRSFLIRPEPPPWTHSEQLPS